MILDFFYTSANLKKIPRQGWIEKLSLKNPESVADHVFSMAVIGMIFADLENYNTEQILKMILLHDLAESVIGDIIPEQISQGEKYILENKAMKKILSDLPISLQKQYQCLWDEYQSNNSIEAKLVHQLDKLEMAIQSKIYLNDGHSKEILNLFFNSAINEIKDSKLIELLKKILDT